MERIIVINDSSLQFRWITSKITIFQSSEFLDFFKSSLLKFYARSLIYDYEGDMTIDRVDNRSTETLIVLRSQRLEGMTANAHELPVCHTALRSDSWNFFLKATGLP